MSDDKLTYRSEILALPPLKMVLGDAAKTETSFKSRPSDGANEDPLEIEARKTVARLIKYLKNNEDK